MFTLPHLRHEFTQAEGDEFITIKETTKNVRQKSGKKASLSMSCDTRRVIPNVHFCLLGR